MFRAVSFFSLFISSLSWGATEVVSWKAMRESLGLRQYTRMNPSLKIAILDTGFMGFHPSRQYLPPSTVLFDRLTSFRPEPTSHGLTMAQIVWSITGMSKEGPHFYLYNTNGFSNFKAAIQSVIDNRIDIVLYSQVWPFGGNLDGTGFINSQVERALSAGVIWINAAGNYRQSSYNGHVLENTEDKNWLTFKNGLNYLRFHNKYDENQVNVTLSWSDFTNDENFSTSKDLDLFVHDENDRLIYDETGRAISASTFIQKGAPPKDSEDSLLSSHAREIVELPLLKRGEYRIRIKRKSNNFTPNDRFRVIIDDKKGGLTFEDQYGPGILPPADHPGVITVGDIVSRQSSEGPTADGRKKPDIVIEDSRIEFTNGMRSIGSSNAAAIFTGIVAVLKSHDDQLNRQKLFDYFKKLKDQSTSIDISDQSYSDLKLIGDEVVPKELPFFVPEGGKLFVNLRDLHYVILTLNDPFLHPFLKGVTLSKTSHNDVLFYSLKTGYWSTSSRAGVSPINLRNGESVSDIVEFRQLKMHSNFSKKWQTPLPW